MSELARLTWPEAQEALERARLAVLPVGSLEQHGPHLTLDTDAAVASSMARRLAGDLGDEAVLCPSVDYGLSEHHMGFPGTLTLRPDTFSAVILEVVESLAVWGVRRLLVVNGHGGNIDALRLVSRQARLHHGSLVASIMWALLAGPEIAARVESRIYGHACEVETSVVMALVPDRVHPDRIPAATERRSADELTDPPRPLVDQAVWMEEWTDDGALGDPSRATRRFGDEVVEAAYGRALAFARRLSERPLPERGGGR